MEAREMHVRHREEGTKPSGRSEQDMHRDKDKHDHTDTRPGYARGCLARPAFSSACP